MKRKESNEESNIEKKHKKGRFFNIILMGVVSFFNDMSSEMIRPVLPLLILALGGDSVIIGLVGGLRNTIAETLKIVGGYLSDKEGSRKLFLYLGYGSSAFFKLLLSIARKLPFVVVIAPMERIGKGLREASVDALICESTGKSIRQKTIGFAIHRTLDTTGAIVGVIIAYYILKNLDWSYQRIIFIGALLTFVSLIPLFFIKEKHFKPIKSGFVLNIEKLPSRLKIFMIISAVYSLGNISYMFYLLRAKELIQPISHLQSTTITTAVMTVFLYLIFNIFYAGFAIPFAIMASKIGKKNTLSIGFLIFTITNIGFLITTKTTLTLMFALYGISYALIVSNQRALITELLSKKDKEEREALAFGTFHTITGIMLLPASLIAGFLWKISPTMTFLYAATMSMTATLLMLVFKKRLEVKVEEAH